MRKSDGELTPAYRFGASKVLRMAAACLALAFALAAKGEVNEDVDKVYVIFKTHLDVGFTDLSSAVTERYINEFIPKALDVSERLAAEDGGERYVWTTGSWLIWKYLKSAGESESARLEAALRRGDIVWNAVPYTVESEVLTSDLFDALLRISQRFDQKFSKHTLAAKMTDVPGHTRGIIGPMHDAGVKFLHVGVNPASPIPDVPAYFRWVNSSGDELIMAYQQDYGTENLLPGGRTAVSVNFTGDNHGPHSYDDVKRIYADLRLRYPNARIVGASFNDVAKELLSVKDRLPVIHSEIGDTWIHGYGSSPVRMAKFRKLSALYSKWLAEGRIDKDSDYALDFVAELGLIAEHTQGMDVKTHLRNWDKYDMDDFIASRSSGPFRKMEESWKEIDDYVDSAISYLPANLQEEARAEVRKVDEIAVGEIVGKDGADVGVEWSQTLLGGLIDVAGVTYQTFDGEDYDGYLSRYLRSDEQWAFDDMGKTGLNQSSAVSATLKAVVKGVEVRQESAGRRVLVDLSFPSHEGVDGRMYPKMMQVDCFLYDGDKKADIAFTIVDKPAVRLPEAYWLSFTADSVCGILAEKVGERVDLMDVVARGNRQMHGIDRYVELHTAGGKLRIWSETAPIVSVGEALGLAYSTEYPDKKGGVNFNLSNNLWGTNFSMWNEGSLTYRFTVEKVE